MPLRVRCRCGQELVVRYSEWVYVLLGLALLAVLLNSAALIFIYLRLEASSVSRPANVSASGAEPIPAVVLSPDLGPSPARTLPLASPAPAPAPLVAAKVAPPSVAAPRLPDESTATIDESLRAALDTEPPRSISSTADRTHEPLCDSVFLRWLFLERDGAENAEHVAAALLLDEDSRLGRRALDRLLAWSQRGVRVVPEARLQSLAALLGLSSPVLSRGKMGQKVLDLAGVVAGPGDPEVRAASSDLARLTLAQLRSEAQAFVASPALAELQALVHSARDRGVDLVILVDVSHSMSGAFEAFQREALWFLPALPWLFPGARVGAVYFRDSVDRVVGLTLAPEGEIWRVMQELKAEGGGDVSEGVHLALRAALSLGRMAWRDGAERHVVLVGDGSPPYSELPALLALLRQASTQDVFHVHALGVQPEEGRAFVPMFPEIAQAGAGRSVTVVELSRLGFELILCLLPPNSRQEVDRVLPVLRDMFRQES